MAPGSGEPQMNTDIHAIDDLVQALIQGDPGETVPLDVVTAMATAAVRAHWIECPHTTTCELCGTEDTNG
jgi:hypothetical protein